MKTITALCVQEKNKKRVSVFLDGEFFRGIGLFVVLSERLKVGDRVDEKRLEELAETDDVSTAFERSLDHISKAMKTKAQMIAYLKKKEYSGRVIAKVIDKLIEYGYINDELYAARFTESRSQKEGKRKIALELKIKGVDKATIEGALATAPEEDESCERVARKYLKGRTLDRELRQKAFRYLVSKGFDYDVARSALERIKDEDEDI